MTLAHPQPTCQAPAAGTPDRRDGGTECFVRWLG